MLMVYSFIRDLHSFFSSFHSITPLSSSFHFSSSLSSMALNNLWFVPALRVIKINVHCVVDEIMHPNDNLNSIGMVARDHEGKFLWSVIGLLKCMKRVRSKIWAVHQAMKTSMK